MKSVNKLSFLTTLENQVTCHRLHAKTVFNNLDEQSLLKSTRENSWSIAHCLAHLNSYGDFYLPKIEAELNHLTISGKPHYQSSWLGRYFINMMDTDKSQKKYKAGKKHIPSSIENTSELVSEFINQQDRLLATISKCRSADLNEIKIPTSISSFICLNLGDLLGFLVIHNERHIRQANCNLPLAKSAHHAQFTPTDLV